MVYDSIHTVSSTREFGYEVNADGSHTFYTRGVDRMTSNAQENIGLFLTFLSEFGDADSFAPADDFWSSFQSGIENFVDENNGVAKTNTAIKERPDWEKIRDVIDGTKPISELDCN